MKSTIREVEENEYPKLKINSRLTIIVLFTDHDMGIIVSSLDDKYPLECEYTYWDESTFKNYNGTVTLKN